MPNDQQKTALLFALVLSTAPCSALTKPQILISSDELSKKAKNCS